MAKNASAKDAVCVSGTKNWSTTHCLRGMLTSLLFTLGLFDSSISLRICHRYPQSPKWYHHIQESEGLRQQLNPVTTLGYSVCVEKDVIAFTFAPLQRDLYC